MTTDIGRFGAPTAVPDSEQPTGHPEEDQKPAELVYGDRKSTRLNSSHWE